MIEYFEKRAPSYEARSQRGLWRHVRQREWEAIQHALRPQAGQSVLEIGCGAGFYSRRLHALGLKVTAVDSSPAMLTTLAGSGITTHLSRAEDFTPSTLFDSVLCAGVLEFVSDAEAVFARARTALRADGRLVILVPRDGLVGRMYELAHTSCPVYLRALSQYVEFGTNQGFTLSERPQTTWLSHVLKFHSL
ncbi:MAG: methyltransferase domain-containing protein [Bdellovibrionales bacterium]|nr:methyltransferase domain-containing protein [Bdellovibrionales bacterium]